MTSVQNTPPGPELMAMLQSMEGEVRVRHTGRSRRDLENLPTLRPYIEHYRRFGKTYHVLLQLESVAFRGRSLAASESLVNAMFAAEIDSLLLTAGHDLGIGERPIEVKAQDMSIRDAKGILSTVIYGPHQRTRLRPESRSVLFTVYAPGEIPDADVDRHLRRIESLVRGQSPSAGTANIGIRRA
jgi:hypothetical protein